MRLSGPALPWQTCMKPPSTPRRTCSADATAIQSVMAASLLPTGRRKDAQPVPVRVEPDEGAAEIHVGRLLEDSDAALLPVCEGRVEAGSFDREGELGAAAGSARRGLDRVARPQAEHHAVLQCKHDERR